MRKIKYVFAGVVSGALLLSGVLVAPSQADETSDVQELILLSPGVTEAEIYDSASLVMAETGESSEAVIAQFLAAAQESQQAVAEAKARVGGGGGSVGPQNGDDPAASVTLPTAYYKGDMYLTPSYSAGVNHGHIGIYGGTDWVVEASGSKYYSNWYWHTSIKVAHGSELLETKLTQNAQNSAANYAYAKLVGFPYNRDFFANKYTLYPSALNCSQLVWLAYKYTSDVDLDGNGGPGVYPYDIRKSELVRVNWTIW